MTQWYLIFNLYILHGYDQTLLVPFKDEDACRSAARRIVIIQSHPGPEQDTQIALKPMCKQIDIDFDLLGRDTR